MPRVSGLGWLCSRTRPQTNTETAAQVERSLQASEHEADEPSEAAESSLEVSTWNVIDHVPDAISDVLSVNVETTRSHERTSTQHLSAPYVMCDIALSSTSVGTRLAGHRRPFFGARKYLKPFVDELGDP